MKKPSPTAEEMLRFVQREGALVRCLNCRLWLCETILIQTEGRTLRSAIRSAMRHHRQHERKSE